MEATPRQYWEAWENDDGTHTVHWGILGRTGDSKRVKRRLLRRPERIIQTEADSRVHEGFKTIDIDEHHVLIVEYAVDGFGGSLDLDKRHRLEDRMNETLGWTGLGHCDGGSIGSGTMEVCCYVVDYAIAKSVIESDLKETEFADYTSIYDEGA